MTGKSYIQIASDNGTATNRTFCLSAGVAGQVIILESTNAQAFQLRDGAVPCGGGANTNLVGDWDDGASGQDYTLQVIYNGSKWIELGRAAP